MSASMVTRAPLWHALIKHFTLHFYPLATVLLLLQHIDFSAGQQPHRKEWRLLIWFHRHLESVAALISLAPLGQLRCGKVSSGSTYYASQNLQGHQKWTPKWCVHSCRSVPDSSNPIHDFAKGKCYWQWEILKKGLWKWKMRGWEGFSTQKCLVWRLKTSTKKY